MQIEPIVHLIGAMMSCAATLLVSAAIINQRILSTHTRWLRSALVWKKFDYIWYGSALAGLAILWMGQVENDLRNEAADQLDLMIGDVESVRTTVSILGSHCENMGYTRILPESEGERSLFGSCLWLHGIRATLDAQATNPMFPGVPIRALAVSPDAELPEWDGNRITGDYVAVTLYWADVTGNLSDALEELTPLRDQDDIFAIFPLASTIPDGIEMDNRVERLNILSEDLIPRYSQFNIQDLWWLYIFSILIGLKLSKTYAELKLR